MLLNFFHNNKVVHALCGKEGNAEKHHSEKITYNSIIQNKSHW